MPKESKKKSGRTTPKLRDQQPQSQPVAQGPEQEIRVNVDHIVSGFREKLAQATESELLWRGRALTAEDTVREMIEELARYKQQIVEMIGAEEDEEPDNNKESSSRKAGGRDPARKSKSR